MKIHPLCAALPPMSDDEFAPLKESIRLHGVRVPAVVHDDQIVDGRHRVRACVELDVPCPTVTWDQKGSLVEFVVATNIHRRHLTVGQRAAAATAMLPHLEAEARERQRMHGGTAPGRPADTSRESAPSAPGKAAARAATMVGVSARSVEDAKLLQAHAPEAFEDVRAGTMTLNKAVKELQAREKAARTSEATPSKTQLTGEPGSPATDLARMEPDTVRCIIAGSPSGDIDFTGLADFARRVLQPGGVLLAITSQEHLPEAIGRLSARLDFTWTLACFGDLAVNHANVKACSSWRPILVFAKGEYVGRRFADVLENGHVDRTLGLSGRGVKEILERFTKRGDYVCIVGAIEVAEQLGRRVIRVDVAEEIAQKQVTDAISGHAVTAPEAGA